MAFAVLAAMSISACSGKKEAETVAVLTTVQVLAPQISMPEGEGGVAPETTTMPGGEGGTSFSTTPGWTGPVASLPEGSTSGSTVVTAPGGANTVPNGGATTTTVVLSIAEQMARNFASDIAGRLTGKTGGVSQSEVQSAGAAWAKEDRGTITVEGYKGTTVENVNNGVKVTVTVGSKAAASFVCAGPVVGVSGNACP